MFGIGVSSRTGVTITIRKHLESSVSELGIVYIDYVPSMLYVVIWSS